MVEQAQNRWQERNVINGREEMVAGEKATDYVNNAIKSTAGTPGRVGIKDQYGEDSHLIFSPLNLTIK